MTKRSTATVGRSVGAALIVSRLLWLGVAIAAIAVQFPGPSPLTGLRGSLVHWDAISFLTIAGSGYPAHLNYLDAFLPGFPLLLRIATFAVRDEVAAAWLVNGAAEAVALWYIAKLVLAERDAASATFAVWLVALAPTAVFLIAPFSEAPFMASASASLYYARAGRPRAAVIAAAIACSIRLTGLALLPALAIEQLRRTGWRPRPQLLLLIGVLVPLAAYCGYMRLRTGDALAYLDAQRLPSFDHYLAAPWQGLATSWNTMTTAADGETRSIFAREVAFGLLGACACIAMWVSTRIPRSLVAYVTVAWLMTSSLTFWRSQPRYILALFPAVLVVADLTRRAPRARTAIIAAGAVLMGAGVWIFTQGRWLG